MQSSKLPRCRATLPVILALVSLLSAVPIAQASSLRKSAIVHAIAKAKPSVVNIHGHKLVASTTAGYASKKKVNGMGTGVVIDPRGYILTNHHVVQGVNQINVTLHDGTPFIARLVAHDSETDLAIIKIPTNQQLPLIPIGGSHDLMVGEEVIAIGNAYGYENTVTRGIIGSLHRTVQVTETQQYRDLIQTDASINPGNSGGPLLNIDGQMIGINVAVRMGAQGIGFAIPSDQALQVAARLLSAERVGGIWHGVVPAPSSGGSGVQAVAIQSQSPAAAAGVRSGDIITRVNRLPIHRALDLERSLIGLKAGQVVDMEVHRGTVTQVVRVQLAASQTGTATVANYNDPVQAAYQVFGLRLTQLPAEHFQTNAQSRFKGGLKVVEVKPGSAAASEGVRYGDVLVGLHEWVTSSEADLEFVMKSPKIRNLEKVKFYILRNGETLFGHLPVNSLRQVALR